MGIGRDPPGCGGFLRLVVQEGSPHALRAGKGWRAQQDDHPEGPQGGQEGGNGQRAGSAVGTPGEPTEGPGSTRGISAPGRATGATDSSWGQGVPW